MAKEKDLYYCSHDKMHFTDGMELTGRFLLSGTPVELLEEEKDKTWGEGFCPNCGRDCKSTKEKGAFQAAIGKDPHADLHEAIDAKVKDPSDPLQAEDAQAAFLEAVEGGVK